MQPVNSGLLGAEQAFAHLRVDAVGRDDGAGTHLFAARELRRRDVGGLRHRLQRMPSLIASGFSLRTASTRMPCRSLRCMRMCGVPKRCTDAAPSVEPIPGFAGAPVPQLPPRRQHLHLPQRLFKSERIKHARAVRADLHAGADFAQHGRLFVDDDVEAALQQRKRGRQPADAAADDVIGEDDSDMRRRFMHRPNRHTSRPAYSGLMLASRMTLAHFSRIVDKEFFEIGCAAGERHAADLDEPRAAASDR